MTVAGYPTPERVWELVRGVGAGGDFDRPPALEVKITDLSSLGLVELVLALEEEYAVTIPGHLMNPESLETLGGIVAVLAEACADARPTIAARPRRSPGVWDRGEDHAEITGSILDAVVRHAAERSGATFLTTVRDGVEQTLTFGGLDQLSRRTAARLVAALAPGAPTLRGHRIALLARNDVATVVTMVAILRAGAACVVLNPDDPAARLGEVLDKLRPSALLTTRPTDLVGERAALEVPVLVVPDAGTSLDAGPDVGSGLVWAEPEVRPEDPAFLFGTSGSTAASKWVLQSHRALSSNARDTVAVHRLEPGVTVLGGLPLHHVNGVHFTVMAIIAAGAHVVIPERIAVTSYLSLVDRHRPRLASVVPSILEGLSVTGRGWRPDPSFAYWVTAAAPLSTSLARRVHEGFGTRVVQGYGLTETVNFSTMTPTDLTDEEYAAQVLASDVPPVGVPLPGNLVAVLDKRGREVTEGVVGEVCMRGLNVMDGYAEAPEATDEALAGDWFHSGDLGRWHLGAAGRRWITLTGRLKNIAKVGGEAVSLEEVERVLGAYHGVRDAACVAVPHALWGEEVVALLCVNEGADLDQLREHASALLPAVAVPRRWVRAAAIPRTTTGKIRRAELADLLATAGPIEALSK